MKNFEKVFFVNLTQMGKFEINLRKIADLTRRDTIRPDRKFADSEKNSGTEFVFLKHFSEKNLERDCPFQLRRFCSRGIVAVLFTRN